MHICMCEVVCEYSTSWLSSTCHYWFVKASNKAHFFSWNFPLPVLVYLQIGCHWTGNSQRGRGSDHISAILVWRWNVSTLIEILLSPLFLKIPVGDRCSFLLLWCSSRFLLDSYFSYSCRESLCKCAARLKCMLYNELNRCTFFVIDCIFTAYVAREYG